MGGVALAFLGLDVHAETDLVGATVSLRFGSAVPRLMGPTSGLPDGVQFLTQVFASVTPLRELTVDFGLFDTPFGAEVSSIWLNPTYTRGALYMLVQPFYHTGFRASWRPDDHVTVTALAVNGWNSFIDNNDGKSGGLQVAFSEGAVSGSIGYLTGPEQVGSDRLRHFIDVVGRARLDAVELTVNADLVAEEVGTATYDTSWGVMVSARGPVVDGVFLAGRAELIDDPDTGSGIATGTLTWEWDPDAHVVIRLDNRVDVATAGSFMNVSPTGAGYAASSVLGVVVHD